MNTPPDVKSKTEALRNVVLALMDFAPLRDKRVIEVALNEYLQASLDEFRARGLQCPFCERRIVEWPIQNQA